MASLSAMRNHFSPTVRGAMLALNQTYEGETGALDRAALDQMLGAAFFADYAGDGADGFIITFDQDGD